MAFMASFASSAASCAALSGRSAVLATMPSMWCIVTEHQFLLKLFFAFASGMSSQTWQAWFAMLQGFPKTGPAFISAVAFHGGIASILGLYTLFWLRLNLMQTLPILSVLGVFTMGAGYSALSQQADSRLKQQ